MPIKFRDLGGTEFVVYVAEILSANQR